MTPLRQIPILEADKLLQPGPKVHVLRQSQGVPDAEETWERWKVLAQLAVSGAQLAGQAARAANHGLATQLADGAWLFFETAHEDPQG